MTLDTRKLQNLEEPLEMTEEEYKEMIDQVADLTEDEATEEWLESCRYGEVDIIRILLRRFPSIVDHTNPDTGNTGLHMAAANGHVHVAQVLLNFGHGFKKNLSGNTPLHFAALNSQADMVQLLTTQKFHEIDVLEQNAFGRSALTEGFTSQDEGVIKSILEHDSAAEEKLLAMDGKATSHVHEFFEKSLPLRIRELAITNADNPFADQERPDQDTTGLSIWSAALVLARWLREMTWTNSTVCELGAGCGVPGLAVAMSNPPPKRVYLTDLNPITVDNLQHNISLNAATENSSALKMDWCDRSTWPEEELDFVIGSDLIYQKSLVPLLVEVVTGLLKPGGKFYYVAPESGRDGLEEFIDRMKEISSDWKAEIATKEYHSNPLASGDDEECFLHFQELSSLTYYLYEFRF